MNVTQFCSMLLLSLSIGACKQGPEPVQTIVLIEAAPQVRESLSGEVYVSRGTDNALLQTLALPPRIWPIKFVLTPEAGDAQRRFSVTFSSSGTVPFGFKVNAGFVAGETRTIQLQIADSCVETESTCRVNCDAIEVTTEAMRASSKLSVPITCTQEPDAETNRSGGVAGAGGSEATDGVHGAANMINVGARAGAAAAGGKAPAANSGGAAAPVAGMGAPPVTGGGQKPASSCDGNTCGAQGKCAIDGSCECNAGFISVGAGNPCEDVDECQQTPRPCGSGKCQNLPGDYSCECSGETWTKADAHSCGRFNPPELLTPKYSSAVPCQPQVAFYSESADQPGKGIAIWITGDSTQALWSADYDPNGGWSLAAQPITLGVAGIDSPRLALNSSTGDGFAIWLQNGTDTSEVRYALRRNGKFGAPMPLTTVEGAQAQFLSAALSANGDGYATWTEFSGSTSAISSRVMVARFLGRTTQTWSGKTPIAGNDGITNAAISRVAVDGQGRATLVWTAAPVADGGTPSFIGKSYAARYDPNATTIRSWRTSGDLDALASGLADVSFETGGKGVSVWQRQATTTSAGIAVAASRYMPGDTWVAPSPLSGTSDFTLMLPRVAVMPGGAAFAMWTQQASGALNVWGSMLDATTGKWSAPAFALSPQSFTPASYMNSWSGVYFDLIDLAADEVGGGVGVYSELDDTNRVIRAVHASAGAQALGSPIEITRDSIPIKPSRVEVGLDARGSGSLIWDQPTSASPASYQVLVSRID
jgi:hypothetical protein